MPGIRLYSLPDVWLRRVDMAVCLLSLWSAWGALGDMGWMLVWFACATISGLLWGTNGTARFQGWLKSRSKVWMVAWAMRAAGQRLR
ncbi:hypothetical protein JKG47_02855 [Acidithiobacillus sp. MC6.1]|nr:hypothetical protein [Acidithiobacillus sp. MC6.1]